MLAGDSALSEDFVQTTFERALRAQQRPAAREIQPWLMRILKNVAIDHWRSAAVRQSCALDPERIAAPSGDTTPWWRELDASELAEAARQLPETFRRVFLLRLDGRSNLEVARQLQLNATTVATRLFRARRLMQRALAASRRAQDPR